MYVYVEYESVYVEFVYVYVEYEYVYVEFVYVYVEYEYMNILSLCMCACVCMMPWRCSVNRSATFFLMCCRILSWG